MRRLFALIATLLVVLAVSTPAALAQDGDLVQTERTILIFNGDATLPAGEQAKTVLVGRGNALIEGTANSVVVIDGTATLRGATVETLTIINGTATIETGSTVTDNVVQLNGTVNQAEGATIGGSVVSLAENMAGFAIFLGLAALLLWIGIALATLVAGLALAAFAARQVRTTEAIISREPLKAFLVGLLMIFIPPIAFVLMAITVVGLPLALGMLLFVWPTLAFFGYLIGAIWIGDWLLRTLKLNEGAERPYLAAIFGLIATAILGIIPLVTAIVSIFGLGALTVAGWRTLLGGSTTRPTVQAGATPVQG